MSSTEHRHTFFWVQWNHWAIELRIDFNSVHLSMCELARVTFSYKCPSFNQLQVLTSRRHDPCRQPGFEPQFPHLLKGQ